MPWKISIFACFITSTFARNDCALRFCISLSFYGGNDIPELQVPTSHHKPKIADTRFSGVRALEIGPPNAWPYGSEIWHGGRRRLWEPRSSTAIVLAHPQGRKYRRRKRAVSGPNRHKSARTVTCVVGPLQMNVGAQNFARSIHSPMRTSLQSFSSLRQRVGRVDFWWFPRRKPLFRQFSAYGGTWAAVISEICLSCGRTWYCKISGPYHYLLGCY